MVKRENVVLHFTGPDFPGQLAAITELFQNRGVEFLDVQQTTSLGQLSLSLMVSMPSEEGLRLHKEILAVAKSQQLFVDFIVLQEGEIVRDEVRKKFALTVLAPEIMTGSYNAMVQAIANESLNIMRMNRLSHRKVQCLELIVGLLPDQIPNFHHIKRSFFQVAFRHNFDLSIQPENLFRRSKRLIIIDMDSTLIQQEVIDEIAAFANVKDKVSEITEKAMRGELDFKDALYERVALLKGIPASDLAKVIDRIHLTPGVEKLVKILKKLGFKIGVISGGFTYFTSYFKKKLGLDYHFANQLEEKHGVLTGKVTGDIVDRARKAELLKEIAKKEQIHLGQTVAVGDGANDLDMLETAGLGIAFNAKPKVKEQAAAFISQPSLDYILYLLGVSESEIEEITKEA